MLFIVVLTCLLCCGMWQPALSNRTMCMSDTYFQENCTATTTETLSTTLSSNSSDMLSSNSSNISSTVTTNEMTSTMDMYDNATDICCYEQMCIDNTFISDCINCSSSCKHGCSRSKPDKCRCFGEKDKTCTDYDEKKCECPDRQCSSSKIQCFLDEHLIGFILIVIVICLIFIMVVVCLVYRCCCHDRRPITALSWKDMKKPVPVAKPINMELTAAGQSTDYNDYDDVYGNVDEQGQVKTESAPGEIAFTIQHGGIVENFQDSTGLLSEPQPNHGHIYGNIDYDNQGRNNASFESEATSRPLSKIKSKPKSSKDTYLPKQLSIPETNPPPPPPQKPESVLGKMLMKELETIPAARQIHDENILGKVTSDDHGGMYEMPNVKQPDYGGDYEVPIPAPAGNQLLGDSKDYGGDYEVVIKDNFSPTKVPDQDFDNTYEPVSPSNHPDTHTNKRKAQELPPVPVDYGGEYENVTVDRKESAVKKRPPPPVQKKKPLLSKKPHGKPAKKPENKPQDYGDTYEAPMPHGIARQPDYGEDYEAPMLQTIAKEQDFGGDYEAPMLQTIAKEQDFGDDYEAPMIQNFAREQDFGGDYETPISQQKAETKPDDPDFGSIYENTMVGSPALQKPTARGAIDPPVEDYNQVYDQPYAYNQPVTFKGMRGDYYNQSAPKASPATNKENYTKLYRT